MRVSTLRTALTAGLGLVVVASAPAHEDDPKILHRLPPVPGSGFLAGAPTLLTPGSPGTANSWSFPSSNFTLNSWLTFADLGYPTANGNDCWGYTAPSGREYALMGTTQGTAIVEVTNPGLPVVVERINGPNSTWRDIKTYGTRAYVVSEGGSGIQVIDLSNVDGGVVTLENTVTGQGSDSTHNVAIDEESGFLYRAGGSGNGLRIYSLANPSAPQYVGQWNTRYVHDVQVVTYTSGPYAGREIAYCCSGFNGGWSDPGLSVVDVTDKNAPQVLSQVIYPNREYSHQGWLSADRTRFYLGDELDEGSSVPVTTTHVFDVADPANATYLGAFDNGDPAIGHNMYERGGFLFQANYTSGIRVFDLNQDLNNPPEVGFFDTAPNSSATTYNGLWSCFVDFPSGTIIGSDRESGLFVLNFEGVGTTYCNGVANSTGNVAEISALGTASVLRNDLGLSAANLPANSNGYFVVSRDRAFVQNPGGSQGNLCVGANTGRYISQLGNSGAFGILNLAVDSTSIPQPTGSVPAIPGDTFNFQCWFRDANPAATSNFSTGYAVTFY